MSSALLIARDPANPPRPAKRRGFAMPLVLLLSLVISVMLGVMLQRQGTQTLSTHRQVERYVEHHFAKGLAQILDQWVKSLGTRQIFDAIGEDGLAFTLETEGGSRLRFFLRDGQGTALSDLAGLTGETRDTASDILAALSENAGPNLRRFTRATGPVAVSAATAPREVLDAVIAAAGGDQAIGDLAGGILSARSGDRIKPEDLSSAIDGASPPPEVRARLTQSLVATPSLFRFEIQPDYAMSPRPGTRVRYSGYAVLSGGREKVGGFTRMSAILSIEKEVY